jgi:ABC-type transporter Mla subunit MlaD
MKNRNFSDWVVALSVIACSAVLLAALAMALSGTVLGRPARSVLVNFPDVTGISPGAPVKYGGANAGRVAGIRMLTPEERIASGQPANTVQVTLALTAAVPPLPADVTVSVSADTLLSDKFLLITGGSPAGPVLAEQVVLQGIPPVSVDELSRSLNTVLVAVQGMMGGGTLDAAPVVEQIRGTLGKADNLLQDAHSLITAAGPVLQDAQGLITQTKSVVTQAGTLVTDVGTAVTSVNGLVADNREPIARTVTQLERTAASLDQLAGRGKTLLGTVEPKLTGLLTDFRLVGQNLKVTSTYTEILTRSLAERPSRLIWGGRNNRLPSRVEILRAAGPFPGE